MNALRIPILLAVHLGVTSQAATLYWDGDSTLVNSASDNTSGAAMNWLSGGNWDDGATSAALAVWTAADNAVFGGTPVGTQTVTLGTGISLGTLYIGPGYVVALNTGAINGLGNPSGVITVGAGSTLTANNTAAGTNAHSIGAITLNGATLASLNGPAGPANDGTTSNWVLNGTVTAGGTAASLISATTIRTAGLGGSFNVADVVAGTDLTVSSVIESGGVVKTGVGTMVLSGNSTSTGNFTLNAAGGTLAVTGGIYQAAYQPGAVLTVNSGATLQLQNWHYSETLGGASLGGLRANTNAIVLNGGAIRMAGAGTTSYYRGVTIQSGGATFEAAAGVTWELVFNATAEFAYSGNPALTLTGAGNGRFEKLFSGSGALTKSGAGTWTMTRTSANTGNTTVSGGVLAVTGGLYQGAYQPGAVLTVNSGATVQLQNWHYSETVGGSSLGGLRANSNAIVINGGTVRVVGAGTTSYSRGLTVQAGGATFEAGAGVNWVLAHEPTTAGVYTGNPSLTFTGAGTGTFGKPFSGSGALTKNGAGTWTLGGDNTYTGFTSVNEGTLLISGSTAPAGLIQVSAGATLGGGGSGGLANVEAAGGIAPGDAVSNHLELAELTFADDSLLLFDLDAPLTNPMDTAPGIDSDHVAVGGFLALNGRLRINPRAGFGTPAPGDRWLLISYSPGNLDDGGLEVDTANSPVLAPGLAYQIDTATPGHVYLAIAVPEAGTAGLLLVGLVTLLRARKGLNRKGNQT